MDVNGINIHDILLRKRFQQLHIYVIVTVKGSDFVKGVAVMSIF
jgi:hypothetical protein